MGKEINMTKVRDNIMERIVAYLREQGEDVQYVGSGIVMMPITDEEGNESYATIQTSIPRGKRSDGTYIPYDGYAAAEEWRATLEAKELEKQIKEENKKQQEAEKARKRALRTKKVKVDDLNKQLKEIKEIVKDA